MIKFLHIDNIKINLNNIIDIEYFPSKGIRGDSYFLESKLILRDVSGKERNIFNEDADNVWKGLND